MKPEPLFYIPVVGSEKDAAGPYDLVQMAGLLRKKIIAADTLIRVEGEDHWIAFGDRLEYVVAREIPPDAVSARVDALDEQAHLSRSPIPLPSAQTLVKLCGLALGTLLACGGACIIALLDATTGRCLEFAGGASVLFAYCMIMVRLSDEGLMTLLLVFFVPFGDIYYFISNIWEYFTWFCVKYVGAAVCAGAALGLALRDAP
jgi:hypothetical protein